MTRQLRVLHTESSVGWGGQEIRILTESRGMIDRGHRVSLVTAEGAEIIAAAERLGVPTTVLPVGKKRPSSLLAMRRWLDAHAGEFDVINTHSSTDSWLVALACQTLRGAPSIVRTRHVSTPVGKSLSSRWLYLHATSHIVTTGEAVREQLHRENGYPLVHMTSVRTGIDLLRFTPLDQRLMRAKLGVADQPTLGIVATLRDWKGHTYLLEAYAALRARFPAWQLVIVGDGPQRANLTRRIEELGLTTQARMVGNQDNVSEWLACMDVFVLPSYGDEGVPQGIMQAMACGIPVVSTPIGSIREAVIDGTTGLLVEPRSVAALVAALEKLMSDTTLRRTLGAAGLDFARRNFGIDHMLDAMEKVFRDVLRRNR